MFEIVASRLREYNKDVLDPAIELVVDIAREGREGRQAGTLFTAGDAENVSALSQKIILDPLAGHPGEARMVTDFNLPVTVKELAQRDGALSFPTTGSSWWRAGTLKPRRRTSSCPWE